MPRILLLLALATTACTTLGPNPVTTGLSAVPTNRPGVELSAGVMPAFYLSDAAAQRNTASGATSEVHAIIEPDRLLRVKGLILGARRFGDGGDTQIEPLLGYRRLLTPEIAVMGVAYGGRANAGSDDGANYEATRIGGELGADARIGAPWSWLGVHLMASVSATYLDATGQYCVDSGGIGIDCGDETRRVDGAVEGIYIAGTGGLAIDFARRPTGTFHLARVALLTSLGRMPMLRDGVQSPSNESFYSMGLALQVGFGSPD